eukprot:CAMPEP_0206190438 /NCGR_PEP_ID=MMETSP0166-20121206/4747_1 /ASSEMBLY_ACC=CAM_ASM_000260 /TAXON_ID=95228 /ORGANISM="Vannella robusta, Strain DIVA3 518/3/11/1/6" /LENGTH=113 /DNA_ID=CAMNT_0053606511 /DNA_START=42 /DNA_END=380 /DNA_ORIENTATION=+
MRKRPSAEKTSSFPAATTMFPVLASKERILSEKKDALPSDVIERTSPALTDMAPRVSNAKESPALMLTFPAINSTGYNAPMVISPLSEERLKSSVAIAVISEPLISKELFSDW